MTGSATGPICGDPAAPKLKLEDRPTGVTIAFSVSDAPVRLKGPWVDGKLVGVLPTVGQTIEDRHGKAIKVDTDINGRKRTQATVGPLVDLKRGRNSIVWSMEQSATPKD